MEAVAHISESFVREVVPARSVDADKSKFGKLLISGGCVRYPHAPVLSALGAIRSGVGLVALDVPAESRACAAFHTPEAIFHVKGDGELRYDVGIFGPGAGMDDIAIPAFPKMLLDADGLNRLAANPGGLGRSYDGESLILTPHPGEAARLLGATTADIQSDRPYAARALAAKFNCVVVLKGAGTLVCSNNPDDGLWRNTTGNPGMATAGSGDVLAGVIGALWAQGLRAFDAACAGAWIHGRAGDAAAGKFGQAAVTASDIARCICVFS